MAWQRGAGTSVVVLCALNLEYRALRERLSGLRDIMHPLGTRFEAGRLPDASVRIVLGRTGEGTSATAALTERAIEMFRPRAVFFVGVAGALKEELELGDVVVATRVYAIHGGKEQGDRLLSRPRSFEMAHELLDLAQHLDARDAWGTAGPDGTRTAFRVHFKPIAAGEVVLDSRDAQLAVHLREHYNDAAAIEMESAGMATAAQLSQRTAMLAVRGLSDRADGAKRTADAAGGQQLAAAHAAEVAFAVIREWAATLPAMYSLHDELLTPDTDRTVFREPVRAPVFPCRVGVIPPEAECFQERGELGPLAAASASDGPAATPCQVLSGTGGVGKTQLAARYARSRWASGDLDVLVWLTAANRESVVSEYARAASAVGAPATQDPEEAARSFLTWLASTTRSWLVVLDDLADPGDLKGLWPPAHATGRAVVTTRRRDAALTGAGRRRVDVGVFTELEAGAYLAAKLAAHGRADEPEQLAGLARDLGYLPIGLAQAVAYLVDTGLDCRGYRARWADRRRVLARLVPEEGALPDDQLTVLGSVWSLSVQRADTLRPAGLAAPLLELAAMLDPNGIPEDALSSPPALAYLAERRAASTNGATDAADVAGPVDPDEAHDALAVLARLNLCVLDSDSPFRLVRIHALLQRATRDSLTEQRFLEAIVATGAALMAVWPEIERDAAFALALRGNAEKLNEVGADVLWQVGAYPVLHLAGRSLGKSGLVAEAAQYFARLSQVAAERLGPDDPATLESRGRFAFWRSEAGSPAEAVADFRNLLVDQTRVLGPDDRQTLVTRGNLAYSQGEAGDPAGAAAGHRELLADLLRVAGPDDAGTLTVRNNLARWRGEAGDAAGAVAEFEQVLADHLRVLGPDAPTTLIARGSVARWRGEAGDAAGAVAAFEELLADLLRVLGPDHSDTLIARNSLAEWRGKTGDVAGAVAALEELLSDCLRLFGPDYPHTLGIRSDLGRWRYAAGDLAAAVDTLRELLADQRRVFGPDHLATFNTRSNLASIRGAMGDAAGAVAAFEELLAHESRVLPADHPAILTTRNNLAMARSEAGDHAGAAAMLEELTHDRIRILGPDHPDTLIARTNLACVQGDMGDTAGAAAALEQVLADQLRILGPDHPDTLRTRSYLASFERQAADASGVADDIARAVTAAEQVLADRLRVLGPDHPDTLIARNNVASLRREAGDAAGAVAAFEELLADQLRMSGPDHPHVLTVRGNLAWSQGETGDAAGAAAAMERVSADRLRIQGPDHPDTLATRGFAAYWRDRAGDPAAAVGLLEELLADQLRVLGSDHLDTLQTRMRLVASRMNAGDVAEAMVAVEALLVDLLRVFGPDHPLVTRTRELLKLDTRRAEPT